MKKFESSSTMGKDIEEIILNIKDLFLDLQDASWNCLFDIYLTNGPELWKENTLYLIVINDEVYIEESDMVSVFNFLNDYIHSEKGIIKWMGLPIHEFFSNFTDIELTNFRMSIAICKPNDDYSWKENEIEEYEEIKNNLISRVIDLFLSNHHKQHQYLNIYELVSFFY